jgi:hypothetical protein
LRNSKNGITQIRKIVRYQDPAIDGDRIRPESKGLGSEDQSQDEREDVFKIRHFLSAKNERENETKISFPISWMNEKWLTYFFGFIFALWAC